MSDYGRGDHVEHDVTEDEGWQDDPRWQAELRDWLNAVAEEG